MGISAEILHTMLAGASDVEPASVNGPSPLNFSFIHSFIHSFMHSEEEEEEEENFRIANQRDHRFRECPFFQIHTKLTKW